MESHPVPTLQARHRKEFRDATAAASATTPVRTTTLFPWARVFDKPGPVMDTEDCTRQRSASVTGGDAATLYGANPWSQRDAELDGYTDVREWMLARKLGILRDKGTNPDMQRGKDEEQEAADLFEQLTGLELARTPMGYIIHATGLVGASPDRRCEYAPLLIEIKSKRDTLKYKVETNYWWQVQLQMAVTGIRNCVLFQYISLREFGDYMLPQVCMHLIQFDATKFDDFLENYARPFIAERALRESQAPHGVHQQRPAAASAAVTMAATTNGKKRRHDADDEKGDASDGDWGYMDEDVAAVCSTRAGIAAAADHDIRPNDTGLPCARIVPPSVDALTPPLNLMPPKRAMWGTNPADVAAAIAAAGGIVGVETHLRAPQPVYAPIASTTHPQYRPQQQPQKRARYPAAPAADPFNELPHPRAPGVRAIPRPRKHASAVAAAAAPDTARPMTQKQRNAEGRALLTQALACFAPPETRPQPPPSAQPKPAKKRTVVKKTPLAPRPKSPKKAATAPGGGGGGGGAVPAMLALVGAAFAAGASAAPRVPKAPKKRTPAYRPA